MFGPYVAAHSENAGYPKPDTLNHPTDVAVDSDGDIYVTDWGNHRVCVFDSEGRPICNLIGNAQGVVEVGPANRRRQSGHGKGAAPSEEPRTAVSLPLPGSGGIRSCD